jgi:hypothetical protein
MKPVSCIATLALSVTSIIAQDVPRRSDSRPVVLLPGLGRHQHPIATASPEAQKFFDQGLIMVYAFNRGEAIRSFQRAAELDPQSPMPYWGIALAHGFHLNMDFDKDVHSKAAFEAIQKAVMLSVHSSQQEREYVAALAHRCSADPHSDERKLAVDYKNAMEELAAHEVRDVGADAGQPETGEVAGLVATFTSGSCDDFPPGNWPCLRRIVPLARRDFSREFRSSVQKKTLCGIHNRSAYKGMQTEERYAHKLRDCKRWQTMKRTPLESGSG